METLGDPGLVWEGFLGEGGSVTKLSRQWIESGQCQIRSTRAGLGYPSTLRYSSEDVIHAHRVPGPEQNRGSPRACPPRVEKLETCINEYLLKIC